MRHFEYLTDADEARLFHLSPQPFTAEDDDAVLALALGATLYSPATRPALAKDIAHQRGAGVLSVVVCLEDAIPDDAVAWAQRNAVEQLRDYAAIEPDGPLIFVRVRTPEQIAAVVEGLGEDLPVLAGFVLPKFTGRTSRDFLEEVVSASRRRAACCG